MKNPPPQLQALRNQIHKVHSTYLDALKYRHEQSEGQPINATQWFMILTQSPDYGWFRPFTQLVLDIDILLDERSISEEQIQAIGQKTDQLFTPGVAENPFGTRFFEMVPQEPELMMIYQGFREARKNLKSP